MRNLILVPSLLAVLLAIAGCAPEATAPAATAAPAATDAADAADAEATPVDPAAAAAALAVAPKPRPPGAPVADGKTTFEFWFSAKTEEDDPRVVDWLEDPCGLTPVAVVDAIPVDDPYLLPDFVVEFDAAGKEVRRWGKPFSAEILGIAGDELLFRAPHGGGATADFRTGIDGHLVRSTDTIESTLSGATETECPALPTFAGSDYVQCVEVTDADGGRHLLAWEGACT